ELISRCPRRFTLRLNPFNSNYTLNPSSDYAREAEMRDTGWNIGYGVLFCTYGLAFAIVRLLFRTRLNTRRFGPYDGWIFALACFAFGTGWLLPLVSMQNAGIIFRIIGALMFIINGYYVLIGYKSGHAPP